MNTHTSLTDALQEAIDNGAAVEAEMTSLARKLERERDDALKKLKRYEGAMELYCKWRGLAVDLYTACVQHYTKDCDQQTAKSFMRIMRAAKAINIEFNTENPE